MNNTKCTVSLVNDVEKNNIFIFYNDFFEHKSKYSNDETYANELMFFTFACTNSANLQNMNFIEGNNLVEMLKIAKLYKFKKAIIQTPGHAVRYNFATTLERYTKDKNWLLIGHLLEYDNYIHLHDQCVVLNLEHLSIDELDPGDAKKDILMPMYNRSEENFHDDYLPIWIEFNEKYLTVDVQWGWKWLSKGLINHSVLTFDKSIRKNKVHLYPGHKNHLETWKLNLQNDSQLAETISDNIGIRKLHLNNNETFDYQTIKEITKKDTFDNVIVLASGFYGLKMYKKFNASNIVYYDILPEMVEIRKNVDENWSGRLIDLDNYVKNKSDIFSIIPVSNVFYENVFENEEDVLDTLEKYRNKKRSYHTIDLIKEVDKFLEIIPTTGSTYIWIDSVYTYWHNIWQYKPHNIQKSYEYLIKELAKRDNEIWIDGKEPNGMKKLFEVHKHVDYVNYTSSWIRWN